MKSAQEYRSKLFKIFLIFSCVGHFVYWSLAISLRSHLGSIPVKSESHWLKGFGEGSIYSSF